MRARLNEFALGTGKGVLVDAHLTSRNGEVVRKYRVHKDFNCPEVGQQPVAFPSENMARAALPGSVKPCSYCR